MKMKIPPKKPHFIKPILPGFKNGLKIPIGFLEYLKGHDEPIIDHAILTRDNKKWLVKLNGRRLEEGDWKVFVDGHDLKVGDFLIFRHEGDMKFEVSIFDSTTHCHKKYEDEDEDEEVVTTHDKPFDPSRFECIIRKYCLSSGFMFLPQQFALANGLTNKKCELILRDERRRSWNIKLSSNDIRAYIGDGWRKFAAENSLKEGDRIMFEIITNGETPIWEFRVVTHGRSPIIDIMKKPSIMRPLNAQASSDGDHPYFVSTIRPYCISKSCLYLPVDFAKSNGLMNRRCEMILKDEAQRCWSVGLGKCSHHFGIISGWTKFRSANGLQVGDAYKFQLIKNGKIPIAQFHRKYSGKVAKREEH